MNDLALIVGYSVIFAGGVCSALMLISAFLYLGFMSLRRYAPMINRRLIEYMILGSHAYKSGERHFKKRR